MITDTEAAADLLKKCSKKRRLLDIGAGTGGVTLQLAPLFEEVPHCTEVSAACVRRMSARGLNSLQGGDPIAALEPIGLGESDFDVVTIFNVLDRAPQPLTLLRQSRKLLSDDGRVVVAVALPFNPYVVPLTKNPFQTQNVEDARAAAVQQEQLDVSSGDLDAMRLAYPTTNDELPFPFGYGAYGHECKATVTAARRPHSPFRALPTATAGAPS